MNVIWLYRRLAYLIRGGVFRLLIMASGGRCGPGLRVEAGFILRHGAHTGIEIGKDVYLGAGTVIDCPHPGKVTIGNGVTLTHGVVITAIKSVFIGNQSLVGEYVSIRDSEHGMDLAEGPIRDQPMLPRGCFIGDDVWIGRGCAILAGSELLQGCVIGANSVVKGTISARMIAAGIPAREIRPRPRGQKAESVE